MSDKGGVGLESVSEPEVSAANGGLGFEGISDTEGGLDKVLELDLDTTGATLIILKKDYLVLIKLINHLISEPLNFFPLNSFCASAGQ